VVCSGKVFYDLARRRDEEEIGDVALVRLEQLYPFPGRRLATMLERYGDVELVWAQEEPANMGAAVYCTDRFAEALGRIPTVVSREASASPATGSAKVHREEQEALVARALS
jgi:2-oxoglutarate dehydrogenase E1 component